MDIVYLGIFITLSSALDPRFHQPNEQPEASYAEIICAEGRFTSLIHFFSNNYLTILDGVIIDPWYIVKRMLAEFAAAVAVFATVLEDHRRGDMDSMDVDGLTNQGEEGDEIAPSRVRAMVDDIIAQSYPEVVQYFRHCVGRHHKEFLWSGPPVMILPRSEASESIVGLLISEGEKLDHPRCPIFMSGTPPPLPPSTSAPFIPSAQKKCRGSTNEDDLQTKKQKM